MSEQATSLMKTNNIKNMQDRVLYEDNHLIVINKLSGEITQGDKTGDTPLPEDVKVFLKEKYNKPGNVYLGVVHRLDRPTSGIVIFAKTSKALSRMNKMFQEKSVQKTYWAVVENKPQKSEAQLEGFLQKNKKQNKSYVVPSADSNKNDKNKSKPKKAILDYKLIKSLDNYFLLEILPKTGRHHQIRVQLANIGCIIKGDLKYGAKRSNKNGSICLHARKIQFTHPVSKEEVTIEAPIPKSDIWGKIEL